MGEQSTHRARGGLDRNRSFAIQLMQHLVVPTFVLDADGKVIVWNLACERLTGLAASEVLGTNDHWKGLYKTRRPCLADMILQSRTAEVASLYAVSHAGNFGKTGLSAENWCEPPNCQGGRRYLAFDAGAIFNDAGELLAVVETLRDITLQKEAQIALERLASQDGLTGIANRRAFDVCLAQEWSQAQPGHRPLSLLMIDIDHFKLYNDSVGHQNGDECLKKTARLLVEAMMRETDLVARYGGEEFAIILPNTTLDEATSIAERLLSQFSKTALPHPGLGREGIITVSIGAASNDAPVTGVAGLVSLADASLYRAKIRGRDQMACLQKDPVLAIAI